jgi:uncharacterized protein (DUF2267 family)
MAMTGLDVFDTTIQYENWKPANSPNKVRSKEEFLAQIRDYFRNVDPNIDAERLVRAVFKLLSQRVSSGEIEDVVQMMPSKLTRTLA